MELGKPDEDFKNAKGNFELVYNSKKYLVPCERRFEINSENIVVGFVSNGCFTTIETIGDISATTMGGAKRKK